MIVLWYEKSKEPESQIACVCIVWARRYIEEINGGLLGARLIESNAAPAPLPRRSSFGKPKSREIFCLHDGFGVCGPANIQWFDQRKWLCSDLYAPHCSPGVYHFSNFSHLDFISIEADLNERTDTRIQIQRRMNCILSGILVVVLSLVFSHYYYAFFFSKNIPRKNCLKNLFMASYFWNETVSIKYQFWCKSFELCQAANDFVVLAVFLKERKRIKWI